MWSFQGASRFRHVSTSLYAAPSKGSRALYMRTAWRLRDSNSRPPACKAGALPTELSPLGLNPFRPIKAASRFNGPMGLSGLEPPTSRLSGVRSNRLSYKPLIRQPPALPCRLRHSTIGRSGLNHRVRDGNGCFPGAHRHLKIRY